MLWRKNKGKEKGLLEKHGPTEQKMRCIQYRAYFFLQAPALSSFSTQYISETSEHPYLYFFVTSVGMAHEHSLCRVQSKSSLLTRY